MARNGNAGKSTGTSDSAKFLRSSPKSRAAKLKYDKEFQKKKKQVKKRVETNRANRKANLYGKLTKMGKDQSHTADGKLVLEDRKINRGRSGSGNRPKLKPTKKKK